MKKELTRKERPCPVHKEAAPTILDAVVMGVADGTKFFRKCEECGWEVAMPVMKDGHKREN